MSLPKRFNPCTTEPELQAQWQQALCDQSGQPQHPGNRQRNGRRTVVLGKQSIDILRKRFRDKNVARQKAYEKWVENGLIFTTRYGTPHHPRNILRDFKILLGKTGLPIIRFHDLRHTAASLMLNHGVPVIVVSRRLGHAKPSITLDVYGHLIPSMQIEAAQKIDELITPVELHPVAPGCTQNEHYAGSVARIPPNVDL